MNSKSLQEKILEFTILQIEKDLKTIELAAEQSHLAATDTELQAKSKYETQAIEAGYLAGAQAKRVADVRADLLRLRSFQLNLNAKQTVVTCGVIVELKSDGNTEYYYILPISGRGSKYIHQGKSIHVISELSPIGKEVIGLEIGESIEVVRAGELKEYEVVQINPSL